MCPFKRAMDTFMLVPSLKRDTGSLLSFTLFILSLFPHPSPLSWIWNYWSSSHSYRVRQCNQWLSSERQIRLISRAPPLPWYQLGIFLRFNSLSSTRHACWLHYEATMEKCDSTLLMFLGRLLHILVILEMKKDPYLIHVYPLFWW